MALIGYGTKQATRVDNLQKQQRLRLRTWPCERGWCLGGECEAPLPRSCRYCPSSSFNRLTASEMAASLISNRYESPSRTCMLILVWSGVRNEMRLNKGAPTRVSHVLRQYQFTGNTLSGQSSCHLL